MKRHRLQKAAAAIRQVVSWAILTQVKDPRVRDVTVTAVELSADMRQAKVHVSIMGTPAQQELALHGLRNAAGFLQSQIAEKIDTRYTPRLSFVLDQGVKKSIELMRLFKKVEQERLQHAGGDASAAEPTQQPEPAAEPEETL